jgi:hypothetical protein
MGLPPEPPPLVCIVGAMLTLFGCLLYIEMGAEVILEGDACKKLLCFFDALFFCATPPLELPLLLRFLITSVFKLRGLTTPCNFKNRPQALHNGWPDGSRLHSGVVVVEQLAHWVLVLSFLLLLLLLLFSSDNFLSAICFGLELKESD